MLKNTPKLPFILVTTLFFMWGLANNMTDTLLSAFKKILSMTDFQTTFVQYAFYGAYFCLAIPAALIIRKYSYKTGILIGLGMFILGGLLFYPASNTMVYGHFLAALFILAGGLSILETSANPYIIAMGPMETGVQRLNLAQSFNPIGSITGVVLSKVFILSHLNVAENAERASMDKSALQAIQQEELSAVMGPYVGVSIFLLVLWVLFAVLKMPKASDDSAISDVGATVKRLIANTNYTKSVIAQFFYVGAQIGVWSFTIRYVMNELNVKEDQAANYYLMALVLFLVARFISTALMKYIAPSKLLTIFAIAAAVLCGVVMNFHGSIGVYALVLISAFMSLMFPTIYGLGLRGLGEDTKLGGSGLIMTIIGGAVITGIQGLISDSAGVQVSYIVPLLCFAVVAWFGWSVKTLKA